MTALHAGGEVKLHVVAQVVKPEFVVRSVGDVGGVGRLPFEVVHVVLDTPDFKSQETVNLTHPFRVARSQIVVDGNDMDAAAASERIKVSGERGYQGFAFAGSHFSDFALMQDNAAD